MSAITDDELFALAMVLAELLASIQMRFDADAAKIAERDAEIARLKVEREDRREDKREMRDEIAKLRAVAVAARELVGWDWEHLLVDADRMPAFPVSEWDVALGADTVRRALAALDDKGAT